MKRKKLSRSFFVVEREILFSWKIATLGTKQTECLCKWKLKVALAENSLLSALNPRGNKRDELDSQPLYHSRHFNSPCLITTSLNSDKANKRRHSTTLLQTKPVEIKTAHNEIPLRAFEHKHWIELSGGEIECFIHNCQCVMMMIPKHCRDTREKIEW